MIKVRNGQVIRQIARRSLSANRARNLIAVAAIALTTVLFASLCTITMSINEGFQQSNFRMVGGFSHGGFKYLTEEQADAFKDDPLIREWGVRRFVGMPFDVPFNKSHVEIGYSDAKQAHWMFCDPEVGRLPREGTNEAAADEMVLRLLGVTPALGAEFTMTFEVDGRPTTQTFTLCGWWAHDEATVADHVLVPLSRAEAIYDEVGLTPGQAKDGTTGTWNLDVMFKNAMHIERDIGQVLAHYGYQNEDATNRDTYIDTGVNWGYSGAQLADSLDLTTALAVTAILLLIVLTGYLIIYNVFQISVTNDIRFYGLLKTIGTTGRQLRRIIRWQALALSLAGIPLGLLLGWLAGGALTPIVATRLNNVSSVVSVRPGIFLASALFSLLTVLLSCRKPGRIAARVSPIEAVRYTEGAGVKRKARRAGDAVSLVSMAGANLGRSRSKTAVTVLSLCLAVVLMNLTVMLTNGFDMDKYLASKVVSDFVLADAGYFQVGGDIFNANMALPQEIIDRVAAQGGVTGGGRVYGRTGPVQEFVAEDYYRRLWGQWSSAETVDMLVKDEERDESGRLAATAQLFGMESFALDRLTVVEGDLSALYQPGSRAIAAVYMRDDYGNPHMDSHWAKLGDTVTLRYVETFEYVHPETGEVYGVQPEDVPEGAPYKQRALSYRDVTYTVEALVMVPSALSYRYYGSDEFVMNAQTFVQDSGTDSVMLYAFNTAEEANAAMETFLADYTGNVSPQFDYESKAVYVAEFESFRSMFLMLGGALSFIVGLVGILNFFNAILTGIIARRREFAVLQSIGMTGRQLKSMLVCEGLFYALGAVALALLFSAVVAPLAGMVIEKVLWFFSYRLTLAPVVLVAPVFALLGLTMPLAVYRSVAKLTIVERLREAE